MSEPHIFSSRTLWFAASGATAVFAVFVAIIGLIVLPYAQGASKLDGLWAAICSAAGVPRASLRAEPVQATLKTSTVVLAPEMLGRPDALSIGRGATLALKCAICHGPGGANEASSPNLAGQTASVIFKELADFKSGARTNAVMSPFAIALREPDMRDLAAFYAYMPRVRGDRGMSAPAIVASGAPMRGIAPCGACHGGLENKAGSPHLEGQPAAYLKAQLEAFATGTRHNDVSAQMRNVARQMTADDVDEAVRYYATAAEAR